MEGSKIVVDAFPDDNSIGIEEMSVTYIQNADTCDEQDHYQRLKMTTEFFPGCKNGELPYYYNIEIPQFDDGKPGHFSVEGKDELNVILNDFMERLKCTQKKKTDDGKN